MIHKHVSVRFDGKGLEKTWSNEKRTSSKKSAMPGFESYI